MRWWFYLLVSATYISYITTKKSTRNSNNTWQENAPIMPKGGMGQNDAEGWLNKQERV